MDEEKDKKDTGNSIMYMPLGMCLGMAIGTAIGIAADNLSMWMTMGMSIGMCLGVALGAITRSKKKEDDEALASGEGESKK